MWRHGAVRDLSHVTVHVPGPRGQAGRADTCRAMSGSSVTERGRRSLAVAPERPGRKASCIPGKYLHRGHIYSWYLCRANTAQLAFKCLPEDERQEVRNEG